MKVKIYDKFGQFHGTFPDIDTAKNYVSSLANTCAWINGPIYKKA